MGYRVSRRKLRKIASVRSDWGDRRGGWPNNKVAVIGAKKVCGYGLEGAEEVWSWGVGLVEVGMDLGGGNRELMRWVLLTRLL